MTSLFSKLKGFLSSLPSSDRVVIAVLSFGLVASLIFSLFAIEADFLVEMPRRGGEVTEGVIGYPRFINPLLAITDVDRDLTTLTHAGLMGVSSDGTIVPVLAKDYTLSEDGKIYTFSIRDDAFFSDNTPVTANDVVFTVTKAQDPNLKSPEISNWINIRVIALDEKTVQFTLPQPYAPFIEDATLGIVPAHTFNTIKNEELPFSPLMVKPVGAGPFTIKKIYQSKDGLMKKSYLRLEISMYLVDHTSIP
jgi:peptide/nickel transport system substrate-binding protein